jgi:hypothetical protein
VWSGNLTAVAPSANALLRFQQPTLCTCYSSLEVMAMVKLSQLPSLEPPFQGKRQVGSVRIQLLRCFLIFSFIINKKSFRHI